MADSTFDIMNYDSQLEHFNELIRQMQEQEQENNFVNESLNKLKEDIILKDN